MPFIVIAYMLLGTFTPALVRWLLAPATPPPPNAPPQVGHYWFESLMPVILGLAMVAIPALGFIRAPKSASGKFLRFTRFQWIALPVGAFLVGLVCGFIFKF